MIFYFVDAEVNGGANHHPHAELGRLAKPAFDDRDHWNIEPDTQKNGSSPQLAQVRNLEKEPLSFCFGLFSLQNDALWFTVKNRPLKARRPVAGEGVERITLSIAWVIRDAVMRYLAEEKEKPAG